MIEFCGTARQVNAWGRDCMVCVPGSNDSVDTNDESMVAVDGVSVGLY